MCVVDPVCRFLAERQKFCKRLKRIPPICKSDSDEQLYFLISNSARTYIFDCKNLNHYEYKFN
jgi:hypothetical protein